MSVERKIKELLNRKGDEQLNEGSSEMTAPMQGSSQKASFDTISMSQDKPMVTNSKDTSKSSMVPTAGDTTRPKQGSSMDPEMEEIGATENGKNASAKAMKDSTMKPKDDGDQMPNMQGDSKKATYTEDLEKQINSIFGEDLSEEFKSKATSIFEAAVIARVNSEMETVVEKLEEQTAEQLVEYKEALVEKIDGYLNYVVEQWMDENQLAIDNGLRSEITEGFIQGLKNLFVESYIEVPEDKYDVVEDLAEKVEELTARLNETIDENVALSHEYIELKKQIVFEEVTKNLASTETEKLKKLVEGVDFDSEELFKEKINVIKENYFPKVTGRSPEKTLVEETGTTPVFDSGDSMSKYVQAISRSVKSR
jgi:regulator of replication initiation timing